jgi:carbonic anhydrase
MKKLFLCSICALVGLLFAAYPAAAGSDQPGMKPDQALKMLQDGNDRYIAGKPQHPNQDAERRRLTATKGQYPFAVILGCSDSRVPAEVLFDQGVGDLFVIRVAGNIASVDEVASIEYGTDHLGSPLVVVLGHSHCGAVTAAAQGAETHGSIPILLKSVAPAVQRVKASHPNKKPEELLNQCIEENVWEAVESMFGMSPILAQRVRDGKLQVVGAIYDIDSGKVTWKGPHKFQEILLSKPADKKPASH